MAILLAVFLTFWTWLYTYKKNATKFWVGLGVAVIGALTAVLIIGDFILLGLWVWAIVDVATKPAEYYQRFPNG